MIKINDNYRYYLLKLLANPCETEEMVTDDYHNQIPQAHWVVVGNYLELNSSNNEDDVCYLDNKRKAIVSVFCVVANCPAPEIVMKMKSRQGTRNVPNNS